MDSLRIEVPATADRLADIRRRLSSWLASTQVPDQIATDMVLAANEAATNCIEHAYRGDESGVVQVEAAREGDRVVVCVTDFGSWRTPPRQPGTRGRGMAIMRAVGDRVELDASDTGTTVRISVDVTDSG
ncbi:ATP-binding protein [Mycolicibacterium sp. XJ1819]